MSLPRRWPQLESLSIQYQVLPTTPYPGLVTLDYDSTTPIEAKERAFTERVTEDGVRRRRRDCSISTSEIADPLGTVPISKSARPPSQRRYCSTVRYPSLARLGRRQR
jgi:hypothetical protein